METITYTLLTRRVSTKKKLDDIAFNCEIELSDYLCMLSTDKSQFDKERLHIVQTEKESEYKEITSPNEYGTDTEYIILIHKKIRQPPYIEYLAFLTKLGLDTEQINHALDFYKSKNQ